MSDIKYFKKTWALLQYIFLTGAILIVVAVILDRIVMPFYILQGKESVLPDTQGMKLEEAKSLLEKRGFVVIVNDPKYTRAFEPGVVYEQIPFPNTNVKLGRRVYITPTMEEKLLIIPTLFGLSERNARLEVERSGFIVDTVLYDYSRFPEGAVISQEPPRNTEAKRGTRVTLEVSLGPQPDKYSVPLLIDRTLNEAKDLLARAGLREGTISYVVSEDLIPYTVLSQSIRAGTQLNERKNINLIVSIPTALEVPVPGEEEIN